MDRIPTNSTSISFVELVKLDHIFRAELKTVDIGIRFDPARI